MTRTPVTLLGRTPRAAIGRSRLPALLIGSIASVLSAQMPSADAAAPAATGATHPVDGSELDTLRREVETLKKQMEAAQARLDRQAGQLRGKDAPHPLPAEAHDAPAPAPMQASADPSVVTPPGIVLPPESLTEEPRYPRAVLGGQYRVMVNGSNYGYHPNAIGDDQDSGMFLNQRLRTWLTVQTSDAVEAYVQVQMGHTAWGENYEFAKTNVGPRWPAADDRVGIMLRYGYLAYHTETVGRVQAGIQGWQDDFGQTLFSSDWDFSVGGVSWVRRFPTTGNTQARVGLFELVEGETEIVDDSYLVTLDLDQPLAEEHAVGLSVYFLPDRGGYSYPAPVFSPYKSAWDAWVGGRLRLALPVVPVNGFAICNVGAREDAGDLPTRHHDGVALKLEGGPAPVGPGAVSTQALYSTGDKSAGGGFRTVAQSARDNFGAEGYWSYLMLVTPQGATDVNDLGVSLQNRGCGLFTVQAKYYYPIVERLSGTAAAGWLHADRDNPANGASDMGTELGNSFTLDLGGGLKVDFGAAVLFTGDFYKASAEAPTPDTLYEGFARIQLVF